jgi:glycosyltransferase involved in cell wall biosynthesis
MVPRIREWLDAVDGTIDKSVKLLVTANSSEVPISIKQDARIELVGRLATAELRRLWVRSRAIYFPPGLESFGFALAEARAYGLPVIAQATPQNTEIAGPALCGFTLGDAESLRSATELALSMEAIPDPAPFDPDAYFDWMLGHA